MAGTQQTVPHRALQGNGLPCLRIYQYDDIPTMMFKDSLTPFRVALFPQTVGQDKMPDETFEA